MEDGEVNANGAAETVTYIGDPNDDFSGPSRITMFGYEFEKNEAVSVDDPAALRKLRGHNHFTVGDAPKPKAERRQSDGLASMKLDELKELATREGVEVDDDTTKAKLITAIRNARGQDED